MLSGWPFLEKYDTTSGGAANGEVSTVIQNDSGHKWQQIRDLSDETRSILVTLVNTRTGKAHHIERASILLAYANGYLATEIAASLNVGRSKVYRSLNRARLVGVVQALDDLPRSGRPCSIVSEAVLWILSLACQSPNDLGYSHEQWTTDLLARYARAKCIAAGHECLAKIGQGTIVKILNKFEIKPHKIKYYLEVRDPDFDAKMVEVLKVYKLAELALEQHNETQTIQSDLPSATQVATRKKRRSKKPERKPDKLLARLSEHIEAQKAKDADETRLKEEPKPPPTTIANSEQGTETNAESKTACRESKSCQAKKGLETVCAEKSNASPEYQAQTIDELLKIARAKRSLGKPLSVAVLSYDEKPGIQAINNTAPDLPPALGKYSTKARDHEYVRCGTVSLLAGTDLLSGKVHALPKRRHRSREFVQYLRMLNRKYPKNTKIVVLLDNHSAHRSKETREYLATVPNRFLFVFTPVHASWLNIIESFFSKMARSALRGMRASSVEELIQRILLYIKDTNQHPVVFRWRYGLELLSA
jgi:transposase